jgi:hypothetical protein
MAETESSEKKLAKAVAMVVDSLHRIYKGIRIVPIPNYEDEDFAIEVKIPGILSEDEVLDQCHRECIKAEDEFDVFILPKVVIESD